MPKEECRESRPVPFSAEGAAWAAAAVGAVRESVGKDVDAQGRLLPSPTQPGLTESVLMPYQRQQRPWQGGGPSNLSVPSAVWGSVNSVRNTVNGSTPGPRRPLAPLDGNVVKEVLGEEVRALERKALAMAKRIKVQDQLIRGFCNLEVARRQDEPA
jgi:hypothetical protein